MLSNDSSRRGSVAYRKVLGGAGRPETEGPFLFRVTAPLIELLTDQGSVLMRNVKMDEIRYRLMQAGFPMGLTARKFVLIKWIMVATLALLVPVAMPSILGIWGWDSNPIFNILFAVLGGFYGWKLPDTWLTMKMRARQFQIQMALPDTIDLITVSVEAGLGLYAAIQRISERFDNPLSDEFLRALQEVRLGRTNAEALRDLARRVDISDLNTLITALVQAEVLGISVANVLRVQAERLREIRSQRAREQAQKAPLKMMFPLVLFIFPALFIVILGPAAIKIIQNPF